MKLAFYIYEHYRVITQWLGTILISWILSLLFTSMISIFLPSEVRLPQTTNGDMPYETLGFESTKSIDQYMGICERNIFDSQKRTSCTNTVMTNDETAFDPEAPAVKSDIGATLLGTTVFSNPQSSFASIQTKSSGESKSYYIDHEILGEAKVYAIERNRVYFFRNGRKEYLEVDRLPSIITSRSTSGAVPAQSGIKVDGNNVKISRDKVDSTLGDLNQVIQESRMVPNFENGQVTGFKIFAIKASSIFDQLGLKNGDVIERINGTTIDSIEKALPMMQMLKSESNIKIDIKRQGVKQTMNIDIQ